MKLYSESNNYKLYQGNMLDMLDEIKENSIDSIVTDPPYELNFMGKGWDNAGVSFNKETWAKCLKVLKPGGHLLAFGGSRTAHRIACAIEDAGFEIRDTIMYLYGSGFPKSQNIGKQLEKRYEDEKTKEKTKHDLLSMWERDIQATKSNEKTSKMVLQSQLQEQSLQSSINSTSDVWREEPCLEGWHNIQKTERELQRCKVCEMSKRVFINGEERWICNGTQNCNGEALRQMFDKNGSCPSYRPQPEQQFNRELNAIQEQWGTQACREVIENWKKIGSCLKPSFEPIIVARKPFKGSLVDNVIEYGVGGINIDECRVETNGELIDNHNTKGIPFMRNKEDYKENSRTKLNIGRFPANTILTYDETDFDEVCGGFPNTKSQKRDSKYNKDTEYTNTYTPVKSDYRDDNTYNDSGSAARYFMNCKYTRKDEEIWKQLLVNNVESNLEILKATKDNIVRMNVEDLLKELKDHYAKYVGNQSDLIETPIVQDIAKMLTWDFKIETSRVIQDFILNYKECIQFLNLVQFVEKMDNIDTTQTTQNLLKLFGYVKVVITNYIVGNFTVNELDQKRYTYQPKASKKDRDEGLDEFEEKKVNDGRKIDADNAFQRGKTLRHNIHPTVKPTTLMQYLVRLVTPKNGIILDPFMGSGSTGKAVMFENKERQANYSFIGIEKEKEYCDIARARIEWAKNYKEEKQEDNQIHINELGGLI